MIKNVRLLFGGLTFILYISTVIEKPHYMNTLSFTFRFGKTENLFRILKTKINSV